MSRVLLGVGSNLEREHHFATGLDLLAEEFQLLRASRVYESEALGFDGPAFFNFVVELEVSAPLDVLARYLRQLEFRLGRPRDATRFSSRTLDLDILTFDALVGTHHGIELPRGEILENAYVLAPLADLVPDQQHPATGETYGALWERLGPSMQPVSAVAFDHGGWRLPLAPSR